MRLTSILHGFLNRVFSRDPKAVSAFSLSYQGGVTWAIADDVLTLVGGPISSVDLTQYTVGQLVTYLSGQGYSVTGLQPSAAGLGAIALLDGVGDQTIALTAFTSLRWAILDLFAWALTDAEAAAAAAAAPAQLSTTTASGGWLDQLGSYLGNVLRQQGELDTAYSLRIPASVLQPKCNNVAMASILQEALGLNDVSVTDVVVYGPTEPLFDGSSKFDGSKVYNAAPTINYGMFDVTAFARGGQSTATLTTQIRMLVEGIRAGGCHLRNVTVYDSLYWDGGGVAMADGGGALYAD